MIFEVNVKHTETYMDSTVGFDDNPEDFLYYDKGKEEFLSENEWKEKHFENRFKLNCYYDKYLPISAYEAERMEFIKLSYDESKFHMPAGIKNELQKMHLINIVRKDGLEAIYELLIDADSGVQVKEIYNATRVITVKDHPDIGPTFNYSPNNGFKTSDQSIAHYYFDILPFFWWGGVRSD